VYKLKNNTAAPSDTDNYGLPVFKLFQNNLNSVQKGVNKIFYKVLENF